MKKSLTFLTVCVINKSVNCLERSEQERLR